MEEELLNGDVLTKAPAPATQPQLPRLPWRLCCHFWLCIALFASLL
jgi:hypothetical protein